MVAKNQKLGTPCRKFKTLALCSAVIGVMASPGLLAAPDSDPVNLDQRVADRVDQMTLEEKIGQMTQAQIDSINPRQVMQYNIGSVLSGGGTWPNGDKHAPVSAWVNLANSYFNASLASDAGVPIVWGIDAVHGNNNVFGATIFPHNIALGATRDPDLIGQIARATAEEVSVTGLDWAFAPTIPAVRNIRWGRTYEGFSEDPDLVSEIAPHVVKALQGNLSDDDTVIATAKHFIGDGYTENGNDQGNVTVSEDELLDKQLPAYKAALAAGAQTVMVTYNSFHGKKVTGDKHFVTDLLKKQLGFDGFVISDYNAIGQVKGCTNTHCPQAINAGIDMAMVPNDWQAFITNTVQDVKDGAIPMSRINDAVTRILRVKMRAGIFDAAPPAQRANADETQMLGSPAHLKLARRAVRESLVLLKNNDQILPIPQGSHVLVAGEAADSMKDQAGGWTSSWQATDNSNDDLPVGQTVWAGIKAQDPDARYDADGSSADPSRDSVAVVVVGETPYAEFMGDVASDSRMGKAGEDTLSFAASYPDQYAVIKRIHDAGVPVVTVLESGRPLYTNKSMNASDAFVAAWLPGSEGEGVADVLFDNAYDFTGKLSYSWPNGPCDATQNVGDADYDPLFKYGYGLTYEQSSTVSNNLEVQTPTGACGNGDADTAPN